MSYQEIIKEIIDTSDEETELAMILLAQLETEE